VERELDLFILGVRVAVFVTFCCQKVSEKKLLAKSYSLNLSIGLMLLNLYRRRTDMSTPLKNIVFSG